MIICVVINIIAQTEVRRVRFESDRNIALNRQSTLKTEAFL